MENFTRIMTEVQVIMQKNHQTNLNKNKTNLNKFTHHFSKHKYLKLFHL